MDFDWHAAKDRANRTKHGVSFTEAESALFDPLAITIADEAHSDDEGRERTIGYSIRLRLLIVIHTVRDGDVIRIISARKATRQEARDHEAELQERLRAEDDK